ncbi:MAG TPA: hypothetical protein VGL32_02065 [Acidimicrobiales bacterium]
MNALVYDAYEIHSPFNAPGMTDEQRLAIIAWLESHSLRPLHIYRVEVMTVDAPLIRVYEYVFPKGGNAPVFDGNMPLTREPYDVLMMIDPPCRPDGTPF